MELIVHKMLVDLKKMTDGPWSGTADSDLITHIDRETYQEASKYLWKFMGESESSCPPLSIGLEKLYPKLSKDLPNVTEHSRAFSFELLIGHPDLVTHRAVYDVKASSYFEKMRDSTRLQLLAYVALMRVNQIPVDRCGIIFPLQGEILSYDVSQWDSSEYLMNLMQATIGRAKALGGLGGLGGHESLDPLKYQLSIGSHIPKGTRGWLMALQNYYTQRSLTVPVQIFLSSPRRRTKVGVTLSEQERIATWVVTQHIKVYVHAPYMINLCFPRNARSEQDHEEGSWSLDKLIEEITASRRMNFRGVVVHTGKHLKLTPEIGLEKMIESLRITLEHATAECPLMIETPAGEGTELGWQLEEFVKILKPFRDDPRFAICVDTCHVFASGYEPDEYLTQLVTYLPLEKIQLIHLNGSLREKGSRVDRHYPITSGGGKMSLRAINAVIDWAMRYGVSMVTE